MSPIVISNGTSAGILLQLAISIHKATGGLPVACKSRHRPGVIVDLDGSADTRYESEALDSAFSGRDVQKVRVDTGKYAGMPMLVSPLDDENGNTVAAIGVIDALGTLSLNELVENGERLRQQVMRDQ